MRIGYIYDYETLSNCFVAVYEHYKSDETNVFVVHDLKNDFNNLINHLEESQKNKNYHIGFNNLDFDAQIETWIIKNKYKLSKLSGCEISREIYKFTQSLINASNNNEYLPFREKDFSIKQIDLYKMKHYDSAAKSSSLKWLQYSMDWYNIQEMPIHHSTNITTIEQINEIVSYCVNDVKSTKNLYNLSKDELNLRFKLTKEYNINLLSASEPRLSKEIFSWFLCEELNIDKYELKQKRTFHSQIDLKDLILPYIQFKTPEFNRVLEFFKNSFVYNGKLKGVLDFSVNYKGINIFYGSGGLHAAREKGVYQEDTNYIIITSDVRSYYPNLAIRNKKSPQHLDKESFCKLYEWFYDERLKIPKTDIRNYVFKILLNSTS